MDSQTLVKNYLDCLVRADYQKMISLFSKEGVVHSPLRGSMPVKSFYEQLFSKTQQSKITLKNVFTNDTSIIAAHFTYEWTLTNGAKSTFGCVDLFKISEEGKIEELTIIYDTSIIREEYECNHIY